MLAATDSGVQAALGLLAAMVIHAASVMELYVWIGRCSVVSQRSFVVQAAVGVINLGSAGLFVLAGVVLDPAIGAQLNGHGGQLEGMNLVPALAGSASIEGALLRLADWLLPAGGSVQSTAGAQRFVLHYHFIEMPLFMVNI